MRRMRKGNVGPAEATHTSRRRAPGAAPLLVTEETGRRVAELPRRRANTQLRSAAGASLIARSLRSHHHHMRKGQSDERPVLRRPATVDRRDLRFGEREKRSLR